MPPINPYYAQNQIHSINQNENLKFLEKFRSLLDEYSDKTSVGEIGDSHRAIEIMSEYTKNNRLHMAYSVELLGNKFSPEHIKATIEKFFELGDESWPCWSFSNHDVTRHVSRWGQSKNSIEFAKFTCALLLSLRGSYCIYQGEELGQIETELKFEELTDPPGIKFWPENKGRDGCRTPMTWNSLEDNAGFSETKPWLPVKTPQRERSVNKQVSDKKSVLNFYKDFIAFRKSMQSLIDGEIKFHDTNDSILSFIRIGNEKIACLFNFSNHEIKISLSDCRLINKKITQNLVIDDDKLTIGGFGFGFFHINNEFNEFKIIK